MGRALPVVSNRFFYDAQLTQNSTDSYDSYVVSRNAARKGHWIISHPQRVCWTRYRSAVRLMRKKLTSLLIEENV